MQNSALFTGEQQVWAKLYSSMTTLLQLIEETRATHEREQFFRHDVLAWIPPFASLSASTQPTSASTNASPYMTIHIFLFGGKT